MGIVEDSEGICNRLDGEMNATPTLTGGAATEGTPAASSPTPSLTPTLTETPTP
jgi:hypothetical protein